MPTQRARRHGRTTTTPPEVVPHMRILRLPKSTSHARTVRDSCGATRRARGGAGRRRYSAGLCLGTCGVHGVCAHRGGRKTCGIVGVGIGAHWAGTTFLVDDVPSDKGSVDACCAGYAGCCRSGLPHRDVVGAHHATINPRQTNNMNSMVLFGEPRCEQAAHRSSRQHFAGQPWRRMLPIMACARAVEILSVTRKRVLWQAQHRAVDS